MAESLTLQSHLSSRQPDDSSVKTVGKLSKRTGCILLGEVLGEEDSAGAGALDSPFIYRQKLGIHVIKSST